MQARYNHCLGCARKWPLFRSLAKLLTPFKQWGLFSNFKIHVAKNKKENQYVAMKQNITGSYNYSSLINCLIFNQGMTHLIKVTGGIGRVNPIFCVPVGGNPALVKVLLIYSLS